MSGGPNPNQAGQLLQAASMVRALDAEAERLNNVIAESTRKLEAVRASRRRNAESIVKLLHAMDCAANHNTGWEARIVLLMAELTEHAANATGSASHG